MASPWARTTTKTGVSGNRVLNFVLASQLSDYLSNVQHQAVGQCFVRKKGHDAAGRHPEFRTAIGAVTESPGIHGMLEADWSTGAMEKLLKL